MSIRQQFAKLGVLLRRRKTSDDLAEEIRSHLEMEEQENRDSGMSADQAHYAALRRFGNLTLIEERSREMWSWNAIQWLAQDIRYGLRQLRHSPGFSCVAFLTLALGIGANTALFSVVNAVMLRPLPFTRTNRLVQVSEKNDKLNLPNFSASVLNFVSWREQTKMLEGIAAVGFNSLTLTGSGEPEQFSGNLLSPALMQVLGISPVAGRGFNPDEENPGSAPVAMIGEGLWKQRFGSDPGIIGRSITLNGAPTTVVGIAPDGLKMISGGEIYMPLVIDRAKEIRLNHMIVVFARMRSGVSLPQAQAEMDAIAVHVGQQYPEVRDWGIHLVPFYDALVSSQLQTSLLVLLCAVGFVLLMACANLANLLLARAATRQREMAVRTAMGASRNRLLRQLLVESTVLSLTGGAAGLLAAVWLVRVSNRSLPANLLPVSAIPIDARVLLFAGVASIATGLLFGIAPAWFGSRANLNEVLRQAGRGSTGRMAARLRQVLAAGEFALATVLLIGAGLLIQTLAHLQRVHLGFDPQNLMTFQLAPPAAKYPIKGSARDFYRSLLDSLQSVPGVRGAAVCSGIPFGNGTYSRHPMFTTGQSDLPPGTAVPIDWRIVSPGYFQAMGIPLLRGRNFTDADGPPASPVMIVSQATARKFWGDADPLGRTLTRTADRKTSFTIVGVVGDVRSTTLNEELPSLYYPLAIRAWPSMDVVVRTSGSPEAMLPTIRRKVHELDPEIALASVRTMDLWLSDTNAQPRLDTTLLTALAAVALLIAAVGIYGVLAYSVSQRTREIGLRMALGATPREILELVAGEGMLLAIFGIGIGLAGGWALGWAVASLLFGVTMHDPTTFVSVGLVLAAVALVACLVPARRATKVDPMVALRHE